MNKKAILKKVSINIVPVLIYAIMRILWFTYRKKYKFIDKEIDTQLIAVSWHGELLISPQVYRRLKHKEITSAIISQHFDGDIIKKVLGYFNILPIRGSSSKGARGALINSIKKLKDGENLLLTPDGPRGPRHSMSDGAVALAIKSKLPIMVISYSSSSYWQLKSWDRFTIPKPFTTLTIYHQIIDIKNLSKSEAKEYLQLAMNRYTIL